MKKITIKGIITTAVILSVSSCTLYQKPKVPPLKNPDHFKTPIKIHSKGLQDKWWRNFHDEKLNKLVTNAMKNNYNYKIALKNIEIANTYVLQNFSNLFPQVNANFNIFNTKVTPDSSIGTTSSSSNNAFSNFNASGTFTINQLMGTASYQVDVWNQIGNSVKQAQSNEASILATSNSVKLTLISSIVNSYLQLKTLHFNISNLEQQLKDNQIFVQLYSTQYRSGLIDFSIVDTAQAQEAMVRTNINLLKKQQQSLEYTLAYLSGEYPENFNLKINSDLDNFNQINLIPAGIPAKMIANRPDIQTAYYQILAFGYLEKENIANFLPNINLSGNYGYASNALAGLLAGANSFWSYGVYATQYIFDYANRLSQYRLAKYQYEAAILNYKNTAINAFTEVDTALVAYKEDNQALHNYQRQVLLAKDQLKLASSQYQAGLNDYSVYLTADLNFLQNIYNLNNQKLLVAQDITQTYAALGMGL